VSTASAALRADAAEVGGVRLSGADCLGGLVMTAVWSSSWADPVSALALLPLILREGWEAMKGKPCCHAA
jgi:divalent metal cation (Fe/Co/Zn/Cd) transporter